MRSPLVLFLVLVLVLDGGSLFSAEPDFPLTEDSKPHAEVPKGELIRGNYTAKEGSVFPGTERDYTIYLPPRSGDTPVPADNRDKSVPAPFMVFQDGVIYQAPTVFDNLIARKEIPPLIGIFIKPGVVPAANENALPRYNRSYEYDSVSDTYARFLIDEFLPAIEAKHGIRLSTDSNDAAISGNSSGGICAFMAAWHRPDRFRRVFTGVGTYVGIHGADQLPVLVRKFEPKPLRVYLQSGTGDNNLYCGDWWMANQTMERALTWAGYDVNHAWGEGGHNQKHASQIFPEVLRWLWRDFAIAKEIKANPRGESKWKGYEVIGDGGWSLVFDGHTIQGATFEMAHHIRGARTGVVTAWSEHSLIYEINLDGKVHDRAAMMTLSEMLPTTDETMLYIGSKSDHLGETVGLIELVGATVRKPIHSGIIANAAAVTHDGILIVSARGDFAVLENGKEIDGKGWARSPRGPYSSAMTLSPDQTMLYVASMETGFVGSFKVTANHELRDYQQFVQLEPDSDGRAQASGLCVDTHGWLYVATALGIQVCDQAGRVNFIIPTPQQPHDVCFGGKDLSSLFIACGDKIYQRQTKARGIVSGQMPPIKPAPPKL